MSHPSEFHLQDVRCFDGAQTARLRPITLLVGENSTGKTTFLGCYRVLNRLLSVGGLSDDRLDFNQEPFSMGSFRDIVRSRRGRDGRIDEFKLGFTVVPPSGMAVPPYPLSVTFSEQGSQPIVSSVSFQFSTDSFLEIWRNDSDRMTLKAPGAETVLDFIFDDWVFFLGVMANEEGHEFIRQFPNGRMISDYLLRLFPNRTKPTQRRRTWYGPLPSLIPVAPLRSRPKRTYDPIRETEAADGGHIPMLMMRLDRTDKDNWSSLHDDLVEFGRESGLFSDIKVRSHGKQMSDPFQLQVKVRSGSHANIMDVGYGVSQSLPILVDVRSKKNCSFLLQQPEVHLHPRAQAELAGLFVQSFKKHGNRFLIETHSDYIIDRVRILVRKRTIKADDVSILYFESKSTAVTIHSMTLDDDGNLDGAPPGYREFFTKETDRLLGFAD